MKEEWRDIKGYEGLYQVSNLGRVKSLKKRFYGLIMKVAMSDGYVTIGLRKNGKRKVFKMHRLVAINFIPNIHNKKIVNHINGVKYDNRLENIEWCTQKENVRHAFDIGCRNNNHFKSKIEMYTINGEFIKSFNSIKDACLETGLKSSLISRVCSGVRNHTGGYKWKYKKD